MEIDAIAEDFRKSFELDQFTPAEHEKLKKLCAMARQNADNYTGPE